MENGTETPSTVAEAETVAADAVSTAAAIAGETASEVIEAVIEQAQEQVEAAQDMAAEITRGAMETELGRQIAALNGRISEWLDGEGHRLSETVTALQTELAQVRETVAATATLALTSEPPQSIPQLSTEQPLTEAVETITEVLPETVTSPVESIPAAPAPKRRKQFL